MTSRGILSGAALLLAASLLCLTSTTLAEHLETRPGTIVVLKTPEGGHTTLVYGWTRTTLAGGGHRMYLGPITLSQRAPVPCAPELRAVLVVDTHNQPTGKVACIADEVLFAPLCGASLVSPVRVDTGRGDPLSQAVWNGLTDAERARATSYCAGRRRPFHVVSTTWQPKRQKP